MLLVDECRSLPAREVIHGPNRHMTVKDAAHVPQLLTIRACRFGTKGATSSCWVACRAMGLGALSVGQAVGTGLFGGGAGRGGDLMLASAGLTAARMAWPCPPRSKGGELMISRQGLHCGDAGYGDELAAEVLTRQVSWVWRPERSAG